MMGVTLRAVYIYIIVIIKCSWVRGVVPKLYCLLAEVFERVGMVRVGVPR